MKIDGKVKNFSRELESIERDQIGILGLKI